MKINKVTVRIAELRKTEEFENRRLELELTADVEAGETAEQVRIALTKQIQTSIDSFFDEDVSALKQKLKRYKDEYGSL